MIDNQELELAWNFVEKTDRNIFLTGKAGTGKTTFLHKVKHESLKRLVVVAPTGVAAINAKGVTIHSFFQMPFGPILPPEVQGQGNDTSQFQRKFNRKKIDIIRSLDLLIIDEISMVRADLLDGIDQVLRKYRDRTRVFGGVQVLMIGDLQQLAPVVKPQEWNLLNSYYDTPYFFSSKALQEANMIGVELKHIFRQQNQEFIHILNEIRNNIISEASLQKLNQRHIPNFLPKDSDGYITLTTHNNQADQINIDKLLSIGKKSYVFEAKVEGDFSEYAYPTHYQLQLKVGAQVMFIKNDSSPEKRYYNGKIGKIIGFEDETVIVKCSGDLEDIYTKYETWENIRYSIDSETKKISEHVKGSFSQMPLRLAWAITVHKSQGLTFDKAIIDVSSSFAHGQTYVALSRCKTLDGIVLNKALEKRSIIQDGRVRSFTQEVEENLPDQAILTQSQKEFQLNLIQELLDYQQFIYPVNRFIKVSNYNRTSLKGEYEEAIQKLQASILNLIKVGKSFQSQLKELSKDINSPETDPVIMERISKALSYFSTQNFEAVQTLDTISFSTDNKEIKKDLKKQLDKLSELFTIKQYCFEGLDKFESDKYMALRAKAVLEKPKKSKKERDFVDKDANPILFGDLRHWRMERALEYDIAPYQIFSQETLYELCTVLPTDKNRLLKIKGMGKVRIAKYGEEILGIIKQYVKDNKVDIPQIELQEKRKPKPKEDTKKLSFEMLKDGKTVEEIAQARSLVLSTVEGHLAYYIAKGELEFEDVVGEKKAMELLLAIRTTKYSGLVDLKSKVDKKFSYGDLKMALSELNHDQ